MTAKSNAREGDGVAGLRERQIAEFQRMRDDAAQAMLGLPAQLESTVQWKINCYDAAITALRAQAESRAILPYVANDGTLHPSSKAVDTYNANLAAMQAQQGAEPVALRQAVADYIGSEGCSCCQGDEHDQHAKRLAELLDVPPYSDGSGYDFSPFRTVAPR
jgi:hypothetical protein